MKPKSSDKSQVVASRRDECTRGLFSKVKFRLFDRLPYCFLPEYLPCLVHSDAYLWLLKPFCWPKGGSLPDRCETQKRNFINCSGQFYQHCALRILGKFFVAHQTLIRQGPVLGWLAPLVESTAGRFGIVAV